MLKTATARPAGQTDFNDYEDKGDKLPLWPCKHVTTINTEDLARLYLLTRKYGNKALVIIQQIWQISFFNLLVWFLLLLVHYPDGVQSAVQYCLMHPFTLTLTDIWKVPTGSGVQCLAHHWRTANQQPPYCSASCCEEIVFQIHLHSRMSSFGLDHKL